VASIVLREHSAVQDVFLDSLILEDEGTTFLWNVSNCSPNKTVSHPTLPEPSFYNVQCFYWSIICKCEWMCDKIAKL